jgi:dipeptidyl aminopeptidase/acylaminoacyl peptidase
MKRRCLLFTLFAVLLHACGGGGGGGDNGGTTTNNPTPSEQLNPQLSGRIFVDAQTTFPGKILDLSTGVYSPIPGMENWDQQDGYPGTAYVTAYPSHDGVEVVETVENCEFIDDSLYKNDCIIIHDSDGTRLIRITAFQRIEYSARLSLDRQYIAIAYDEYGDDNISLKIIDRAGSLVSYNNLYEELPDSYDDPEFDWLPDGRLVYMVDQTIYITAPYDTHGTPLITFTEEQGEPQDPAVSPDGKKLAFELDTGGSFSSEKSTVWVMSLDDTSDLHQLAVVPGDDDPSIIHPIWSPDGNWIMVTEGISRGMGPILSPNVLEQDYSTLYAVPSDGVRVELTLTDPTTAIPVLSNWRAALLGGEGEIKSTFTGRLVAWVP